MFFYKFTYLLLNFALRLSGLHSQFLFRLLFIVHKFLNKLSIVLFKNLIRDIMLMNYLFHGLYLSYTCLFEGMILLDNILQISRFNY